LVIRARIAALAGFLVGFRFTPPDRRVFMNDFRWELIWLVSAIVEGAVILTVGVAIGRCESWLRARQSGRQNQ
jgi:hypothetical protein